MAPKSEKRQFNQQFILDAARSLIAEKGFSAITLQDILDSAGITKGRFFHYFSSKDELFAELIRSILSERDFPNYAEVLSNSATQSPFAQLRSLVELAIQFHRDGLPESMRLCVFATFFFPPDSPELSSIRERLRRNLEILENLLAESIRCNELPSTLNPQLIALAFPSLGIGANILGFLIDHPRLSYESLIQYRTVLDALHAPCCHRSPIAEKALGEPRD